ncbi:hypothetical protein, partial [Thiolapillus sp.]|uniref:hypothetical protein n=1 Tax=Thiolapillus sp. TaxID=2017437 RepID=UPI003AF82B3A
MLLRTWLPYDWTPRSEAYFVFPLAQGTPGKQCGLAATGVYQPSLRSPWLAASVSDAQYAWACIFSHTFAVCLVDLSCVSAVHRTTGYQSEP